MSIESLLRAADARCTHAFDRAFAPRDNPWRHLGGLAFLALCTAVVSGVVCYALFDTSVDGAYRSGVRLQEDIWMAGRLLRGLHRYAADAFMLLTLLHLLREWAHGHFAGVRWFSWLTGIPLIILLWISGMTGLWLLWDERALFSLSATAEWLQALPLMPDELGRNFLTPEGLNDRFFSLLIFVHIGIALLLLAGLWVHVQRLSLPRLWPPRFLVVGTLCALSALALLHPASSLAPASFHQQPAVLSLDWFYQFVHPLAESATPGWAWAMVIAAITTLCLLPASARPPMPVPARVTLENCNGCRRCAADCPFDAIRMVPRTDRRSHVLQAAVLADRCASCGICVGACPSSTPFRRIDDLVSGIELPGAPLETMRERVRSAAAEPGEFAIVFRCSAFAQDLGIRKVRVVWIDVPCVAMVPPAFVEFALRLGAAGIIVAGCTQGGCEYRLGDRWMQERFQGVREPGLRTTVERDRVALISCGADSTPIARALLALPRRAHSAPQGEIDA
ncbi:MAG TPA: hydrogenase iron-sulfur subunit [Usitatibacteraceae bacterium]|nr:hydrogenase iron-sulfur subunit [Usitatibacteraceae bacterium]